MNLGSRIAELRKEYNMTQEQLASKLNISNQAVSKWESAQSCPDVALLPQLADIFGVSLDTLFGRREEKSKPEVFCSELPWENDDKLHMVLYIGHKLLESKDVKRNEYVSKITIEYNGPVRDLQSQFAVACGNVEGSVNAGTYVACGDIGGDVNAGAYVACGDIDGDVNAGTYIVYGDSGRMG